MNDLDTLSEQLSKLIPDNKPILFACIGTPRVQGDALGPLVGTYLKEKGFNVLGTMDNPVHGTNLQLAVKLIEDEYSDHFVVAIDACLGENIGKIHIKNKPLAPGRGVNRELPLIGQVSIYGVVNKYWQGFEFLLLAQTPWERIEQMADQISLAIDRAMNKAH